MGRHLDSSITRVRPFFQPLLQRDPSGLSWIPTLLRLGNADPDFGDELARHCGPLLPWVSRRRIRPDRSLRRFGVGAVELEECFEHRLPPPEKFLRWLIEHPGEMSWPEEEISAEPGQRRREELFGHHGFKAAAAARAEAIAQLDAGGADGTNGKWWAFEGFTQVDCLLETENLILLVEGKRMEKLSVSTRWLEGRDQLLRSLDVAAAAAERKNKEYAVILLAEDYVDGIPVRGAAASLPHLSEWEQARMLGHYLGCVTWRAALSAVFFPDTVEEAARRIMEREPMSAIA
jgi:hypothetical protein